MIKTTTFPNISENNLDLNKVAQELSSIKTSNARNDKEKLKKVCTDFEAIFIEKLWEEMKKTVSKNGLFSDPINNQYIDLFDFEFARKLAQQGGIGLSKFLYNNLVNQLEKKSEHTIEPKNIKIQDVNNIHKKINALEQTKQNSNILDKINKIADDIEKKQDSKRSFKIILPVQGKISSYFGMRIDPFLGVKRMHNGIDIAAPIGTEIKAATDGEVIFSGEKKDYGQVVIIKNKAGLETIYAHNKENLVHIGDIVKKGDVIAKVGLSGRTTGPHVHFEVRINNRPVNPLKFIDNTLYAQNFLRTKG